MIRDGFYCATGAFIREQFSRRKGRITVNLYLNMQSYKEIIYSVQSVPNLYIYGFIVFYILFKISFTFQIPGFLLLINYVHNFPKY